MKKLPTTQKIIDQIHQAALDPEEWPSVIEQLQHKLSSTSAGLFVQDNLTDEYKGGCLLGADPERMKVYEAYYVHKNPWFHPECLMEPGRILTDQSLDEYYKESNCYIKTEFYNDWAIDLEFRHALGGTLLAEGSDLINFTYFRPAKLGPYTPAEINLHKIFARHIRQAVMVNKRLQGIDMWKHAAATLVEQLPCGVILLDNLGRVLYLNSKADGIIQEKDGLALKRGTLVASSVADNKQLSNLIQISLGGPEPEGAPASMSLKRPSGKRTLSLLLVPVAAPRMLFASERPALVLFLTDPEHQIMLENSYLQQHYQFTAAEAGIARCLAQGLDLKAAALAQGIGYETARGYLKQIFQKTGTNRQHELVRLLLSDFAALLGG